MDETITIFEHEGVEVKVTVTDPEGGEFARELLRDLADKFDAFNHQPPQRPNNSRVVSPWLHKGQNEQ